MYFRQVLYRDLGCASYILGDEGEAVVVDPRWDIEVYLEIAGSEGLRIRHVLETHVHADHVSGRPRLARLTGARSYSPAQAEGDRAGEISAGQEIGVGSLRLRALAVPGHRPEHLAYTVSDLSRGSEPWLVLTGDSLLVGDLARPDLVVEPEAGARTLRSSLDRLLAVGDHVEIWPAHVGGSLCGGSGLSGKTSSTVGFERRHNPLLSMDEEGFVRGLTEAIPPRPPNVDRIVELNRTSAPADPLEPGLLEGDRARAALGDDVTVLDGRMPDAFDAGHVAGAVNLPGASPGVGTRAGWLLSPEDPIVIAAEGPSTAQAMTSALQAVGLWRILGLLVGDAAAWKRQGFSLTAGGSWTVEQLANGLRRDAAELVDVRDTSEWIAGHVQGSHHVPLHRLRDDPSVDLCDIDRTIAVACSAGMRAAFAASLLRRAGHRDVVRVAGGGIADLAALGIDLTVGG